MTDPDRSFSVDAPELEALVARYPALDETVASLAAAGGAVSQVFDDGGRLYTCGNGGSASDSEHLVGELVKSFRLPRPCPPNVRERLDPILADRLQAGLPAVSLVSQAAAISAIANDQGADLVYAQQLLALGRPGDVLIGFSTSGTSPNIRAAFEVATALEICTVLFTGTRCPAQVRKQVDVAVVVPAKETAEVQEYHLACYHALCAGVERLFFG